MKAAVLIPVYNNAGTIEDVVTRARAAMGDDVLVVVDGATDGSGELAARAGAQMVVLPCNRGKGAALRTGFAQLLERGYTHAIVVDADGQHLPEQIPVVLAVAAAHPQSICIGVRRMDGPDVPPSSRKGRAISNFWATVDGWQKVRDAQCGMRVYPLEAVLALPCQEERFAYEMEVLIRASWAGLAITHADIDVYYPAADRVSHFDMRRDNLAFTWLSFRLFWGMVARIPRLAFRWLLILSLALALNGCGERSTVAGQPPVLVGAASSMMKALPDLLAEHAKQGGSPIEITYASSGALVAQVRYGAPFDVVLLADAASTADLIREELVVPDSARPFALGRLQLVRCAKHARPVQLADLAQPDLRRIGLPNPELAPYGAVAKKVLVGAGLWTAVESRVVRGENVGAVDKYCATGNVDAAFLPASMGIGRGLPTVDIPASLTPELVHTLVVLRRSKRLEAGRAFAVFLGSEVAQRILRRYGFALPEPSRP